MLKAEKKYKKRVWPIYNKRNLVSYIGFAIVLITNIVLTLILQLPLFDLCVSITGILYVAILAERNILNFGIGFVNVILYIILCYQTQLFGEAIFYIIDLILIIPALIDWKKSLKSNDDDEKLKVKSKTLKPYWYAILPFAIAAFTFGYGMLLNLLGGEYYFWDALSSGVTFVATILSWKQFREQWIGWIFVYIVSIILWAAAGNVLMIVMSVGCLLFSAKGFYEWWATSKKQTFDDKKKQVAK